MLTPLQIKFECQERARDFEGDSPFLKLRNPTIAVISSGNSMIWNQKQV